MAKPSVSSLTNANQALFLASASTRRHLAIMIKLKCDANVSLQLVLRANVWGGVGKNSPIVFSRLWTKIHVGESLYSVD